MRRVPAYVAILVVLTAGVALLDSPSEIGERPILFGLLCGAFLLLEHLRIDLFERAHVSPSSVATMALAFLFGPIGPILAELLMALVRMARRIKPIKALFDLGSCGLAGAAAAVTYHALPGAPVIAASALGGLAFYAVNIPT